MSTEVIQTPGDVPPSPCEQLLDFAYGELDSDTQAAFERHLAGCARCQAELSAIERVRGAVRAVLPMVEPPSTTMEMGALHAQLLHAAAQRKPAGGGKVLEFKSPWKRVQRVVMHPAFAAAAVFVLVGGVVGLQWKRSIEPAPMAAPMTPEVAAPAAPVAATPATKTPAAPAAEATPEEANAPKVVEKPDYKNKLGNLRSANGKDATSLLSPDFEAPSGALAGKKSAATAPPAYRASKADKSDEGSVNLRPAATQPAAPAPNGDGYFARREAKAEVAKEAKPAESKPTPKSSTNAIGGATSADDLAGLGRNDGTWNAQTRNWASPSTGSSTGSGGTGRASAARTVAPAPAKPVVQAAPPPPTTTPAMPLKERAKGRAATSASTSLSTPPAGAAFGGSAPGQALESQTSQAMPSQHIAQQTQTRDVRGPGDGLLAKNADGMRKKADELARTGRCDEANQIYQQLEKTVAGFKLTVLERGNLSHCRGLQGRMRSTQDELDALKTEEKQRAPQTDKKKSQRMPQDPMFDVEESPSPSTTAARPAPPPTESPAAAPMPTSAPPRKAKREKAADSAY